jgi:hypothetical protein
MKRIIGILAVALLATHLPAPFLPKPGISYYKISGGTNTLIVTNTVAGALYTIQGNTNLMATSNWTRLMWLTSTGIVVGFSFTTPSNNPAMYFRVYAQ